MDTFYAFCFITWATLLELSMLVLPRALVGEGGELPSIGNTGMCRWKGCGFQAIYSGIGSSNHRKLV